MVFIWCKDAQVRWAAEEAVEAAVGGSIADRRLARRLLQPRSRPARAFSRSDS